MSSSKVVLCTGANQGLGYSILKIAGLRHSDYTYILCSRDLAKGKDAADQLEKDGVCATVDVLELDVTKDEHIEQAVAYMDKTYGKLDVLVNNAGILGPFPQKDESLQTVRSRYDLLLSVNLASVAVVTYAFTPLLHKSAAPKVISISSGLGSIQLSLTTKMGRFPPYGATKIGLNGLMVHLQVAENDRVETGGPEAEPACIRHYVCAPGALRTAFSGFKDGLRDPDRGAEVVVRLLEDDNGKYEGGSYWEFEEDEMRRRPW